MKLFAQQVRTYVPAEDYRVLGTDGFGRSDSRENLRHHFEVDDSYVVVAALGEMAKRGEIDKKVVADTYVPADDYRVLGTDGFGRSDSRENLRHHFEVDASYVVVAALGELAKRRDIDTKVVADEIAKFNIDADKVNPRLA